jgi:hypothetical protein
MRAACRRDQERDCCGSRVMNVVKMNPHTQQEKKLLFQRNRIQPPVSPISSPIHLHGSFDKRNNNYLQTLSSYSNSQFALVFSLSYPFPAQGVPKTCK